MIETKMKHIPYALDIGSVIHFDGKELQVTPLNMEDEITLTMVSLRNIKIRLQGCAYYAINSKKLISGLKISVEFLTNWIA